MRDGSLVVNKFVCFFYVMFFGLVVFKCELLRIISSIYIKVLIFIDMVFIKYKDFGKGS